MTIHSVSLSVQITSQFDKEHFRYINYAVFLPLNRAAKIFFQLLNLLRVHEIITVKRDLIIFNLATTVEINDHHSLYAVRKAVC